MKKYILREVDAYLFNNLKKTLRQIYDDALLVNHKCAFTYEFFNTSLLELSTIFPPKLCTIPNLKTIEYLKPYIKEYAPIIKRREQIQYYLLQFMNQSSALHEVIYLLPGGLYQHLVRCGLLIEPKELVTKTALTHVFQQKPEYNMLKQQEVLLSMGL